MTLSKTLAAIAASTFLASSAMAGGFATEIVEPIIVEPTPPGSSLPGWVIPAIIVAALIGVASSSDDDDGTLGTGDGTPATE